MNLASVLPHDEAGNDIHKTLLSFNQRVTDILIKRSADPSCGREALQHEAENILAILKRICTEKSFSGKSQVIATAIEPDLTELVTKIEALETYADVENLIEGYIPTIAAKEFLVRYKDVEEKNIHCEDCGRGYLKSCKGLKGKVSLECRLCNHHQESPFQIKVRLVY
jgi:hypothetical protein